MLLVRWAGAVVVILGLTLAACDDDGGGGGARAVDADAAACAFVADLLPFVEPVSEANAVIEEASPREPRAPWDPGYVPPDETAAAARDELVALRRELEAMRPTARQRLAAAEDAELQAAAAGFVDPFPHVGGLLDAIEAAAEQC